MYKYIEYSAILIWHVISKIIGYLWFYVILPFRRYANNTVFNYVLQNNIYLKRLLERPIEKVADGWVIHPYHDTQGGFIKFRHVSYLEYKLVYWIIWGFLDSDANDDTFDIWRVNALKSESKIMAYLLKDATSIQYGNAFDLGDNRKNSFHLFATMFWNNRNTAQNFLYMQFQKKEQPFLHRLFGRNIGWTLCEDGLSYQLSY